MKKLWISIALLVIASGLAGALLKSGEWIFGLISMAFVAWATRNVFVKTTRERRAVGLLLDALRNDDYSRRINGLSEETALQLHDIADILRKLKKNAVEQELVHSTILRHISSGVILVDSRGYVLMANDKALEILGVSVLTHIDRLQECAPDIARSIIEMPSGGECRKDIGDGCSGRRVLHIHARVLEVAEKTLTTIVITDISREIERNETESWIRLTRMLVHEINNSLTPIVSIADMLKEESDSDEAVRGLSAISRICGDIKEFVNGVRSFSHIAEPSMRLVEIRPLLEDILQSCQGAGNADVSIVCDGSVMAWTDPALLGRAVGNVVLNAFQVMETVVTPRLYIRVRVSADENVVIDVSNNGPRISDAVANDIFVPFFTTRSDGQGIGLALSRRIMIALGGNLSFVPYSASDSDLTTFRFEIR
ncbi:sensor histidine kinase [Paramuribaculum intestinale]|uniref:sensor histidine kinase n=1 Tax=Paramuribaculum intestinale TaxID=2094151 RepID=UPI0025B5898E|nr:ATP-binding protein [Paramuribaculum intestinale]